MTLTEDEKRAIGVALNEATLVGLELDPARRLANATFAVLTLREEGPPPEDCRVQILFWPVGRLAASLRLGRWDDPDAEVVPFTVEELLSVVQSFGGLPIYGWECIDLHDEELAKWGDRLSLDHRAGTAGMSHSILLFQEGHDRHLDILLWFDKLQVRTPDGSEIPLSDFTAAGKRWWDGLYSGDPRTQGYGIFPCGSESNE
jgi:hypothetical protein